MIDRVFEWRYPMKKHNKISTLKTDLRQKQRANNMTELQTDQALINRLKIAAARELTAEEVNKQRVSYILGTLKNESTVTRSRIKDVLAEHEGKKSAA
jgi:hypothetical protein